MTDSITLLQEIIAKEIEERNFTQEQIKNCTLINKIYDLPICCMKF
ncbi:hypothetical protein J4226_05115 [Candidatus Pacearchaeota archaeon]|nr:hypothetical protein [Candidatus Pacearchaeota archaeon]